MVHLPGYVDSGARQAIGVDPSLVLQGEVPRLIDRPPGVVGRPCAPASIHTGRFRIRTGPPHTL